jgi:hypothetical protein
VTEPNPALADVVSKVVYPSISPFRLTQAEFDLSYSRWMLSSTTRPRPRPEKDGVQWPMTSCLTTSV